MTTSLVLTGGNFAANSRTAWTYTTGTITATHTAQMRLRVSAGIEDFNEGVANDCSAARNERVSDREIL